MVLARMVNQVLMQRRTLALHSLFHNQKRSLVFVSSFFGGQGTKSVVFEEGSFSVLFVEMALTVVSMFDKVAVLLRGKHNLALALVNNRSTRIVDHGIDILVVVGQAATACSIPELVEEVFQVLQAILLKQQEIARSIPHPSVFFQVSLLHQPLAITNVVTPCLKQFLESPAGQTSMGAERCDFLLVKLKVCVCVLLLFLFMINQCGQRLYHVRYAHSAPFAPALKC